MTPPQSNFPTTTRFRLCQYAVWLALLLSMTLCANAQVMFSGGGNYPAGTGPWGIVSGDFNGDGYPDIAVANHGTQGNPGGLGNGVSVLIGRADGTFNSAVSYPGGLGPTYLAAGDFNRDGKLDLVTANNGEKTISVFPGNGDGTFRTAVNYTTPNNPNSITTADFNRDGLLDFAIAPLGSGIGLMLADGAGGFRPPVAYAVASEIVSQGDFNNDNKLDLVTASGQARTVSVLLGNGDGTFQTAINSSAGPTASPRSVAVGDFNRDGKADVAVAFLTSPTVNIMLGNGDGSLRLPSYTSPPINTPVDLKAADFNGDGKMDLVSTGIFLGPNADVFLGRGDGTMQAPISFGLSPGAISVSVADYNSDTKPDLAIVVNGQVSVVMLNATPGLPDDTDYFIHQHYVDFLSREPDVFGFDYWTEHIDQCGNNPSCLLDRRIGTSAAFLIETEFQQTGYFVYRLYDSSFGRRPTYSEFTVDRKKVIGGPQLNASKAALVDAFVQRDQFRALYPDTLSNLDFVSRLFDSAGLFPFAAERQAAVDALNTGATRATVLRSVADNSSLVQREYNSAFVQMQYFGYLRRTEDQRGFQFWLDVLNQQPNDFRRMVCAFITSDEYQRRFTINITHSNAECGP